MQIYRVLGEESFEERLAELELRRARHRLGIDVLRLAPIADLPNLSDCAGRSGFAGSADGPRIFFSAAGDCEDRRDGHDKANVTAGHLTRGRMRVPFCKPANVGAATRFPFALTLARGLKRGAVLYHL